MPLIEGRFDPAASKVFSQLAHPGAMFVTVPAVTEKRHWHGSSRDWREYEHFYFAFGRRHVSAPEREADPVKLGGVLGRKTRRPAVRVFDKVHWHFGGELALGNPFDGAANHCDLLLRKSGIHLLESGR
jgi:hypothetical protein